VKIAAMLNGTDVIVRSVLVLVGAMPEGEVVEVEMLRGRSWARVDVMVSTIDLTIVMASENQASTTK